MRQILFCLAECGDVVLLSRFRPFAQLKVVFRSKLLASPVFGAAPRLRLLRRAPLFLQTLKLVPFYSYSAVVAATKETPTSLITIALALFSACETWL
jgi:hypothetical protein